MSTSDDHDAIPTRFHCPNCRYDLSIHTSDLDDIDVITCPECGRSFTFESVQHYARRKLPSKRTLGFYILTPIWIITGLLYALVDKQIRLDPTIDLASACFIIIASLVYVIWYAWNSTKSPSRFIRAIERTVMIAGMLLLNIVISFILITVGFAIYDA